MTVESLEATGHIRAPRLVDEAGNADGYVCARPHLDALCLAQGFDPCPFDVVYKHKDNSVRGDRPPRIRRLRPRSAADADVAPGRKLWHFQRAPECRSGRLVEGTGPSPQIR